MATRKALWEVISYPDSSNLDNVLDTLRGAGAKCHWCTHDDPRETKVHTHIMCGWDKKAPTWAEFVEILKSCGAVCPGERGSYDPTSAEVHDPCTAEKYQEHDDPKSIAAGKPSYKGKAHCDEAWNVTEYQTYTEKRSTMRSIRKEEKIEKVQACTRLFDVIVRESITEYCTLVDYLRSSDPELLGELVSNCYPVKAYLDSLRGFNATISKEREKDLLKQIRDLRAENERLRHELTEANQIMEEAIERTRAQYEYMTGETAPFWGEI